MAGIDDILAAGQQAGSQAQFSALLQLLTKFLAALPGSQASGSWNPVDASTGGVPITINHGLSLQFGNFVLVEANITYGSTSDGGTAKLSLPIKCGAASAIGIGLSSLGGGGLIIPVPQAAESYLEFFSSSNAVLTNADLSGATIGLTAAYIAGS